MALGNQAKALIQAGKTKGWDPTVIQGTGESIANFDKPPDPWIGGNESVGSMPDGMPDLVQGMPDGYDANLGYLESPKIPWTTNRQSEPNVRRGTHNANPAPGKPGA